MGCKKVMDSGQFEFRDGPYVVGWVIPSEAVFHAERGASHAQSCCREIPRPAGETRALGMTQHKHRISELTHYQVMHRYEKE
jgi:hypothetical protein